MSRRPRVVLVGPPGAGKTSVGEELARRWDVPLVDTDAEIEAEQDMSISDLFVERGEAAFRGLEEVAVAAALEHAAAVVAVGGGAVLSEVTRGRLAGHRVVFLDVGFAIAASRVGLGVSRPLLLGNVRSRLKSLMDERRSLYLEVATATVDAGAADVSGVADAVCEALS